jgi:hypothetical protein
MMRLAAAALLALALGTACGAPKPPPVDFSEAARDYRARDYKAVYERWTRHDWALHEVDSALEVWATFKSWDFREAYIERYASVYSLSEADRRALRQAQLESFRGGYEFHMTTQSANYKWNDLEKKDSAWRVTLLDGLGRELTPEYLKINKLPDAYEREFFPSKTPFTKTFALRFAIPGAAHGPDGGAATAPVSDFKGPKSGSITLRIASPLGRVELVWRSI